MPFLSSLPSPARLADLFRAFPDHASQLFGYVDSLMRGPVALDIKTRELVAGFVSGLNACQFCYGSHRLFAEAFGLDEGLLEKLVEDLEGTEIDAKTKALLIYARKLNTLPSKVVQADIDALHAAGWSDQAICETAQINGLFNMMNRIIEGTGIDFDYETAPDASRLLGIDVAPQSHRYT